MISAWEKVLKKANNDPNWVRKWGIEIFMSRNIYTADEVGAMWRSHLSSIPHWDNRV